MRQANRKDRHGFTTIELVCTIVILSVLATYALPRVVDVSEDAYDAVVSGTAGAFSTSVFLANLSCRISSWANRDNLPGYAGNTVDFNTSCYPTDTSNANKIAGTAARCARIWSAILSPAPTIQTGAAGNSEYRAFASGENCRFRFLQDTTPVREIIYNAQTGDVTPP